MVEQVAPTTDRGMQVSSHKGPGPYVHKINVLHYRLLHPIMSVIKANQGRAGLS